MAVWISRAVGLTPEPSSASSRFSDVDADMWWAPHVEVLADLRIVSGCGTSPARFCPNDAVTRGQMATTLVRAFGRSVYHPQPNPDLSILQTMSTLPASAP